MSEATTDGICIRVRSTYWPERSAPEASRFAFTYVVQISNGGEQAAQLRRRHWVITDANGRVEEIRGEGVVGKQPTIGPGKQFEYESWVMLRTPFGAMRGTYLMARPDGSTFEAKVAEFALTQPHALH